jgi:hypothetical protein
VISRQCRGLRTQSRTSNACPAPMPHSDFTADPPGEGKISEKQSLFLQLPPTNRLKIADTTTVVRSVTCPASEALRRGLCATSAAASPTGRQDASPSRMRSRASRPPGAPFLKRKHASAAWWFLPDYGSDWTLNKVGLTRSAESNADGA